MPYSNAIPQPSDKLKVSQGDLLNNFQAIKSAFDVNHVALTGNGGDEGKHKFVSLPDQAATGDPAVSATELTVYSRVPATAAFGTSQQVFIERVSGAQADTRFIPLTAGTTIISAGNTLFSATGGDKHGFAFLGTGMGIKYGNTIIASVANDTEGAFAIPLTVTGPNFIGLFHAQITLAAPSVISASGVGTFTLYIDYTNSTNTSLSVFYKNRSGGATPASCRIYYTAIGQVDLTTT